MPIKEVEGKARPTDGWFQIHKTNWEKKPAKNVNVNLADHRDIHTL